MKVLLYAAAILGGGGAAETFKDHHPFVGVPMFILGIAALVLLLVLWQRANSGNG
ncbi:MAG TPA: hypothetical protein VFA21_10170 [Pyrinomonadaceae bacterium]|nr:hypothetical protein [Pyrinomonadaceae bacterium]